MFEAFAFVLLCCFFCSGGEEWKKISTEIKSEKCFLVTKIENKNQNRPVWDCNPSSNNEYNAKWNMHKIGGEPYWFKFSSPNGDWLTITNRNEGEDIETYEHGLQTVSAEPQTKFRKLGDYLIWEKGCGLQWDGDRHDNRWHVAKVECGDQSPDKVQITDA